MAKAKKAERASSKAIRKGAEKQAKEAKKKDVEEVAEDTETDQPEKASKPDGAAPKYTMRCYLVTCGPLSQLAATSAEARAIKKALVEKTGRRPKDAVVENHELPYGKRFLLDYINKLRADYEQKLLDSFNPPGAATRV
jgi:hypothetical protein